MTYIEVQQLATSLSCICMPAIVVLAWLGVPPLRDSDSMWARLKSSLRKSELLGDTASHKTYCIDAHDVDHTIHPSRPLCLTITASLQMVLVLVLMLMALRQEVTALTPLSGWQW